MNPEVLRATTDDGTSLPIIDVTNPAFTVAATNEELAAMAQKFIEGMKQMQDLPASVRESYERSTIGRGIKSAQGSFLSGITTYMFKVGPGNLGPDADPMDQGITASFPAFVMRLRLQDMARMLADGLAPIATASPHRSL